MPIKFLFAIFSIKLSCEILIFLHNNFLFFFVCVGKRFQYFQVVSCIIWSGFYKFHSLQYLFEVLQLFSASLLITRFFLSIQLSNFMCHTFHIFVAFFLASFKKLIAALWSELFSCYSTIINFLFQIAWPKCLQRLLLTKPLIHFNPLLKFSLAAERFPFSISLRTRFFVYQAEENREFHFSSPSRFAALAQKRFSTIVISTIVNPLFFSLSYHFSRSLRTQTYHRWNMIVLAFLTDFCSCFCHCRRCYGYLRKLSLWYVFSRKELEVKMKRW